eukprot:TRINITY_DN1305_c0_g1_i1.p1 TRINITY_DN1305_c0_g1~~TRINITY_DN1305_c0_g1_i1.p1  ORF type:complete len:741 (+),score=115.61 TRINITY_DN1305_c0_g1_i1:427-2649(+)
MEELSRSYRWDLIEESEGYQIGHGHAMHHVFRKQRSHWIQDDAVSQCYTCAAQFTTILRRHHCRACGLIFCRNCSDKFIPLPKLQGHFPTEPDSYYYKASTSITKLFTKTEESDRVRVCNECYNLYAPYMENDGKYTLSPSQLSELFKVMKLDITTLWICSSVCKSWNQSSSLCLASFRHIQYHLPTREVSTNEKYILWDNRHLIQNHARYFVRFLLSVDWDDPEETEEALDLLFNTDVNPSLPKHKNECWSLMCTRLCKPGFTTDEALQLLGEKIQNIHIRNFAIQLFNELEDEELSFFLPVLVHYIRFDPIDERPIANFLIERSLENESIRNDFHWLLVVSKYEDVCDMYSDVSNLFIKTMEQENVSQLRRGEGLVKAIRLFRENMKSQIHNLDCNSEETKSRLRKVVRDDGCFDAYEVPLNLPVCPEIKVQNIDYNSLSVKTSATMPIVINCIQHTDEPVPNFPILYKSEDLRKDYIVVNIIRIMDKILKEEAGLDMNIVTYRVLPTTLDDGIIQIIPNSETIYAIEREQKLTIQNWINDHNENRTAKEIRDTFLKSTAAYCIITYLLGIGDRHLHNIMVTNTGVLFHIDFGFILGHDPKLLASYMRLTEGMLGVIGGEHSRHYQIFKDYCLQVYNCLRRHASLFVQLLLLIPDSRPPIDIEGVMFSREQIEDLVMQRFIPGQASSEAKEQLYTRIAASREGYVSSVHDMFHGVATEGTGVHSTLSSILEYTSSLWG